MSYADLIISFRCKQTEKVFNREFSRKFMNIQSTGYRKLVLVDSANGINDLRRPPSNHLEALSGDRKGQHSIKINKQWRICFEWQDTNAHNVEIVDYH